MTQSFKRSLLTLAIWGSVSVAYLVLFFVIGRPDTYVDDPVQRRLMGLVLAVGYLGYGLMMRLTRVKPDSPHLVTDERDQAIGTRAASAGLVSVAIYVYLLALGLWETFQEQRSVPVGWMWFMAYSTVCLSYVSTSVAGLVLHRRG